ncbi:glycosyltransferase family 4 protein [Nocardioides kongjuensis]|uniref:Glycosyltransferase involved in cell wall biosynthesis n=1 Tax=Nocardioides kongjuensis TaxID=349522 RepID=A0A852RQU3_9ACTN|nr:glycosyltransferase family 1 protein [Nocardioides kongjuensis]NYD30314.1 glycosyltransferase involved in cell wall biosynthesis [Nocardioides kongjuensis]
MTTESLRVAVELVYFTGRKGGTESYARELFPVLAEQPGVELVGIAGRELRGSRGRWFPGELVHLPVSGENRLQWAAAVALAVGPRARLLGADLLHCPANFGPAFRALPTVVTVHDLLPLKHPEWVPGGRSEGVRRLQLRTIAAADRLLADSAATASDITALTGRAPGDVDIAPLGAPAVRAAGPRTAARPFVLTGGNRMPHKNFPRLVEAWSLIPAAERPLLVVTGSHGADPLRVEVERLGLQRDVELRGWIDAAELAELYASASCYVFPTLFEGFGLPVLEAMASGCPVVGSDVAVLREVGGEAMARFDPWSAPAIAAAVRRVVADPGLRDRLRRAGLERAASMTWDRTARLTLGAYRRLAGH